MGQSSLTSSTSSEDFSSLEWKRSNSQVLISFYKGSRLSDRYLASTPPGPLRGVHRVRPSLVKKSRRPLRFTRSTTVALCRQSTIRQDARRVQQGHGAAWRALTPQTAFFVVQSFNSAISSCGIGSCGVPRPSLGGYVTGMRAESGVPAARER